MNLFKSLNFKSKNITLDILLKEAIFDLIGDTPVPYKHPNGTTCMTIGEFWSSEAKKEGKEPFEVMDEFYTSIAMEEENCTKLLMKDSAEALNMLKKYYDPEYVDIEFTPVEILKMISANVHIGMRKCSTTFTAKVKCSDNVIRYMEYSQSEYSGSFYEPPDFDCNCRELSLDEYKGEE